jgi:3,4-dihydroxy 2-butanone 4-phosphate synthase / GTP cyclohydrolase II
LQTYLITMGIRWQYQPKSATERYERLEQIRRLASRYDLLLQEEARPLATAVFATSDLVVHLGLDQPGLASPDWFQQPDHPYRLAITQILDEVGKLTPLSGLEFLLAIGSDPLIGLQGKLDRQGYDFLPSKTTSEWQPQQIYSFSFS